MCVLEYKTWVFYLCCQRLFLVACQCISNLSTVSNATVFHHTGDYERSQGFCSAEDTYHFNKRHLCETMCDADTQCTGYSFRVDSNIKSCYTFTSQNAVGDDKLSWYCFMKSKCSQAII